MTEIKEVPVSHTKEDLMWMQKLPLDVKVSMTKNRISEFVSRYGIDGVYVSFSGGKDSTVLLHIVREMFPSVPAVFCDTGLEYPEIREFVRTFDNVTWLRPSKNFKDVIMEYGYPFISKEVSQKVAECRSAEKNGNYNNYARRMFEGTYKDKHGNVSQFNLKRWKFLLDAPYKFSAKCCHVMKKRPARTYEKATGRKPFLATMTCESLLRKTDWLRHGCNAYDNVHPKSQPMSFWTEQDVLGYIVQHELPICSVYGEIVTDDTNALKTTGANRTGCMFCGYGCHLEKEGNGRFERLKETHPKQYHYIMKPCSQGGLGTRRLLIG